MELSLPPPFQQPFFRWTWVGQYQNDSILDFTAAKDDGVDEWQQLELSDVLSSSQNVTASKPTSTVVYRPDALPVAQPTVSEH